MASPLRQAPISIGVRKSVANDPGTAPSGAGAATGTGMKPSTSVTSLISMAAVGTTSVLKQLAGGSYHEDDVGTRVPSAFDVPHCTLRCHMI